jgi:hypothetical protein
MEFADEDSEWSVTYNPMYNVRSKPAPHIGHQQHLCDMCESGRCSLDQVKELVKDSKFLCRKCGRTAVHEENLCEPVPL